MQRARIDRFQQAVLGYYHAYGRHDLPWRQPLPDGSFDPYRILVSEMMLQQTQVSRVIYKFTEFLGLFPDFQSLAAANLGEVLQAWSGLGYNRRAKFLRQTAQQMMTIYDGRLPRTRSELVRLPGIGPNTAGALLAYAYDTPAVFIETNIRTVFIHHFFADQQEIEDKAILEVVARALPDDARGWYWALMDYGVHLKQEIGNLNKLSKHYTVQPRFVGSKRQLRGRVLRHLVKGQQLEATLRATIEDVRLPEVLAQLLVEGMIERTDAGYKLPGA
ncbi:MAG TPA: A/G-specific adenine glycosylase [Patescibacteria group bacterium]|nr:A/G-specific adenine glycosylase [Patescibacteria group bacterium]